MQLSIKLINQSILKLNKSDIYADNFSSTEFYKHRIERENISKMISSGSKEHKSPMRTISNFTQMKSVIKKVNQRLKGSRPAYNKKSNINKDHSKSNSLIADSG